MLLVVVVGVGGVVCGATRAGRTGCETGAADQRGGFGWSDGSGMRVGLGYEIPYFITRVLNRAIIYIEKFLFTLACSYSHVCIS